MTWTVDILQLDITHIHNLLLDNLSLDTDVNHLLWIAEKNEAKTCAVTVNCQEALLVNRPRPCSFPQRN